MNRPQANELRQFGLILAVVITALWLLIAGLENTAWLAAIDAVVILAALTVPAALRPVHWLLLKFGHTVSKVLNPLLLGLVYFVIITPMGLVMRLFRYDPMRRRFEQEAETYRESSDDTATQRFDRPF
jgi:hypothetical protein